MFTEIGCFTVIDSHVNIGRNVKIGKDCHISEGCQIGEGATIVEGSVLPKGTIIPPYAVVRTELIDEEGWKIVTDEFSIMTLARQLFCRSHRHNKGNGAFISKKTRLLGKCLFDGNIAVVGGPIPPGMVVRYTEYGQYLLVYVEG